MKVVEADNRNLTDLLGYLLTENPNPRRIDLYWQEPEAGEAPDFGLIIAIQAAALDGFDGELTQNTNLALEGGDGSPNTISDQVYNIPGGLGVVIAARRREKAEQELSEQELADMLKKELGLDADCEVECHNTPHKYRARREKSPALQVQNLQTK